MKIQALDMHVEDEHGVRWAITMGWNPAMDVFGVSWHKMLSDFKVGNGVMYTPATFEDCSFVTRDSLPGCIMNTVQILVRGDTQEPRGLQFAGASHFPLSPNGKTLLQYLDLLKKFPGYECVAELVRTLGRGEDFLAGIPIHTDIIMARSSAHVA